MMNYAHESLLRSFSADPSIYVVLPTGSGSTGAIEKAMKIISEFEKQKGEKPIVYLTPYEHHSNILPWVEFYDHIEVLSSEKNGNLVMSEVLEQLKNSPARELIVSVSAASNVTSTITDLKGLNAVISSWSFMQRRSGRRSKSSSQPTALPSAATTNSISRSTTNLTSPT